MTLDSQAAYWVALNLSATPLDANNGTSRTLAAGLGNSGGNLEIVRPGVKCFLLERVSSLFPVRGKSGSSLIVTSDRVPARGQEKGAQIGSVVNFREETRVEHLVDDEGSGVLGSASMPAWSATSGGSGTAMGAVSKLTKNDTTYDWLSHDGGSPTAFDGQYGGQILKEDIAPASGISASAFTATESGLHNNEYEDCVLECTADGSGTGTPIGERVKVKTMTATSTAITLTVWPDWSITPDTQNRFKVLSPPWKVRTLEGNVDANSSNETDYEMEVEENDEDTLTVDSTSIQNIGDATILDGNLSTDDGHVNFSVGRECRWEIPATEVGWDLAFDNITREHILTNGEYPLLRYDGRRLRKLSANSDPSSPQLQTWLGLLSDRSGDDTIPDIHPASLVHTSPPTGRFVEYFMGRLVVAGIRGAANRVSWSAPGVYNNIWPLNYRSVISDSENNPISGMAALGDQLVVFTPTSIHSTGPADDNGNLAFQPRSVGVGFISNKSVAAIPVGQSNALIGANADGVYLWSGGEPLAVLDDWERGRGQQAPPGPLCRSRQPPQEPLLLGGPGQRLRGQRQAPGLRLHRSHLVAVDHPVWRHLGHRCGLRPGGPRGGPLWLRGRPRRHPSQAGD